MGRYCCTIRDQALVGLKRCRQVRRRPTPSDSGSPNITEHAATDSVGSIDEIIRADICTLDLGLLTTANYSKTSNWVQ